jgi:two-component system, sensor histidine kinase PdtaS
MLSSIADHWPKPKELAFIALALVGATLVELPESFDLPGKPFLLYSILCTLCTLIFGLRAGLIAVGGSSLLSTLFFDPVLTFRLSKQEDFISVVAFAAIASASALVLAWIKALIATRASVGEKQKNRLMLSEMAHRVANNFASATALIGRTSATIHDVDAKRALDDAVNQLHIFASIHNQLRPDSDGNLFVDSHEFIGGLCAALEKTSSREKHLRFAHPKKSITLPLAQAVALGLIINELVTNSIKYAFPEGDPGTIDVTFESHGTTCHVCVADNGVGKSGEVRGGGRGLRLVEGLAEQIGGSFSVETSSEGTSSSICFSLPRTGHVNADGKKRPWKGLLRSAA